MLYAVNRAPLPSDVRDYAILPAWRLLAGKCCYCFLSCVHEVTTMSEVTNISVCCHRKIPEIQQSLGLTAEYPATSKLYH